MTAERYELNYDWAKLGPTRWAESSIVTLQIDLESYDNPQALGEGVRAWWGAFERDEHAGNDFAYEGGCQMIEPSFNDDRPTMWLVSHGQDAFDTLEYYAQQVYDVATGVDPKVRIVWTELPHQDPEGQQWPVDTGIARYLQE